MLKSLKAKIIAVVASVSVVCTGVVAAVVLINSKPEEKTVSDNDVPEVGDVNDMGSVDVNVDNELNPPEIADDKENYDDYEDEELDETYYISLAQRVATGIDDFFRAFTTGDIDTVVDMCYAHEDSEYYEMLVEMQKYDCTPEFMRIMFGNIKHCINEEVIEDLADRIADAYEDGDEDASIFVDMAYSEPVYLILQHVYLGAFPEGTELAKRRNVENNEEALKVLEQAIAQTPMHKGVAFWITLPDKEGNFKVISDYVMEWTQMDEIGDITERYPIDYVEKHLRFSTDIKVGRSDLGFADDNEVVTAIDGYLSNKDFVGLTEYVGVLKGEDYATEYGDRYGRYEELTDTQKQFVDTFLQDKMTYRLYSYINNNPDSAVYGYTSGLLLLTYPILDDRDNREIMLTDWYQENNVVDYSIAYPSKVMRSYSDFVFYYYCVIEYAKNYIE